MTESTNVEVFSWQDTSDYISLFDALECYNNGQYFETPINQNDLIDLLRCGVHHSSALQAKLNILKSTFRPTKYLNHAEFEKVAFNFLVMGNGYLEAQRNRFGDVLSFKSRLSRFMRRASNLKDFVYLRGGYSGFLNAQFDKIKGADVVHIIQPDLRQEIYGLPYYLAALNSIELNASATRFRRRYYDNGSHAGFILYSTDSHLNESDWAKLKTELKKSQGKGNFKNMFLRSPSGNADDLKLIPIAEVAAKDEFMNIKNVSAEDMLAIHRVPPKLMGIVPKNAGSLGDARTDAEVFAANEVTPIQQQFLSLNDQFDLEIFSFEEYVIRDTRADAKSKSKSKSKNKTTA